MNRKLLLILTHVLGCLFFLALPYLIAANGLTNLRQLATNPHEQRNVLSYGLSIAFFYLNYFVLIPRFFFPKRYVLYGTCIVTSFVLVQQTLSIVNRGLLTGPVDQLNALPRPGGQVGNDASPRVTSLPDNVPPPPGLPPEGSQTFFLFLAGGLLSMAIQVNNRWRETERRQLSSELSYLKAQINPHFLFNSLNSIYALAIIESADTPEAITRLSGLMRYAMQDANQPVVPLTDELAYIEDYVALQRFRLSETVNVSYRANGTTAGLTIAPMLLISMVENAFKYGVNPSDDGRIQIEMTVTGHDLHVRVFNKKVRLPANVTTTGIGLSNTKTRLDLIYPGNHRLLITDESDTYTVDLYLTLT